jgi:hypothetical protein
MKSQRRHELQHNALASWLAESAQTLRPYQNILVAALVLAAVAVAAYGFWTRASAAQTAEAWDAVNASLGSGDVATLLSVAEKYPDKHVGRLSAVVAADLRLAGGCNQLFMNKAMAENEITKAIDLYQTDLKQAKSPWLIERAMFGLARADESKGDLESATKHYRQLVENWPQGAYAGAAGRRLNDLARNEIKRLYDDIRNFDPKPAFDEKNNLPGEPPKFDLNSLPKEEPAGQKLGGKQPLDGKQPAEKKETK